MATTLKHPDDSKNAGGTIDLDDFASHAQHGIGQILGGAEKLISTDRVDLADGSHLTVLHHKAA